MRYHQLILSLVLLFTFVVALPTPASVEAVAPRANGGGKQKGGGSTTKEVKGIDKNIGIQKQEKQDAKAVKNAEGTGDFKGAKNQLLGTIKSGEKVRAQNQKNADKSNKQLVNGLKKVRQSLAVGMEKPDERGWVQGAQATEEKQAKSLNGNPVKDDKTLNKLQGEFSKGIQVNKDNKKAAQNGGTKGKTGR
ncbi:hypothetical protein LZ30DRAFT_752536 [Colletotrichum cereale]|nr:hypothetical protein LZ30DRAFT_752536 [Colletotrichum cereale]